MLSKVSTAGRRGRQIALCCAASAVLASLCSCIQVSTHSTTSHVYSNVHLNAPPVAVHELSLVPTTVGLFIGVSNYDESAKVYSTPAHTLSAAEFRDTFYEAAQLAGKLSIRSKFGLPPCCLIGDRGSIQAIAFSADGKQVVTGSLDGSVTVWDISNAKSRVLTPKDQSLSDGGSVGATVGREITAVFTSWDDSRIASIAASGIVTIWPFRDAVPISTIEPGCMAETAIFSHNSSNVLITCTNGTVQLYSSDSKEHVLFPTDKTCGSTKATFGPKGDIGVANCNQILMWPPDGSGQPRVIGKDSGSINSISFSPDESRILTAGLSGAKIWPVDHAPTPLPIGTNYGPAEMAVLSEDGSRIAVAYEGKIVVFGSDLKGDPKTFYRSQTKLKSMQLSSDGRFLFWMTPSQAWFGETTGVHGELEVVRPLLAPPSINREFKTAALSSDGTRVAIGFADGVIGLNPVGDAIEAGRHLQTVLDDQLKIVADLRMSRSDPNSELVARFLERMPSTKGLAVPSSMAHQLFEPKDSGFAKSLKGTEDEDFLSMPYFGHGDPVTRKRILDAITDVLSTATKASKTGGPLLLVIYVSAHGLTGSDGHPYILPSDADAQDQGTWIRYEEILGPIYSFIDQQHRETAGKANAIVVLDTCQTQIPSAADLKTNLKTMDLSRPGVIVVEGTAPGEYSWQWQGSRVEEG
jgi:WD40 repeat protein